MAFEVNGVMFYFDAVRLLFQKFLDKLKGKLACVKVHMSCMDQFPALGILIMCTIGLCKHRVDADFAAVIKDTIGQFRFIYGQKLGFFLPFIFPYIVPVILLHNADLGEIVVLLRQRTHIFPFIRVQIHKVICRRKGIPGIRNIVSGCIADAVFRTAVRSVSIGIAVHNAGSGERNLSVVFPFLAGALICVQPAGILSLVIFGTCAVLLGNADLISFKMPVIVRIGPGSGRGVLLLRIIFFVPRNDGSTDLILKFRSRNDSFSRISSDYIKTAAPGFLILHPGIKIADLVHIGGRVGSLNGEAIRR